MSIVFGRGLEAFHDGPRRQTPPGGKVKFFGQAQIVRLGAEKAAIRTISCRVFNRAVIFIASWYALGVRL